MSGRFSTRPTGFLLAVFLCTPGVADAHVKWFCGPIDSAAPPLPFRQVVTPLFLELLVLFVGLVVIGAMLDALIARHTSVGGTKADRIPALNDVIARVGVAVYALCLWNNLAVVLWADPSSGSILTPDLYGTNRLVGLLQLAAAITVLIPSLSIIAAAILVMLYALGVVEFGLFYKIDYFFFIGLAAYIALSATSFRWLSFRVYRVPILVGCLSLSLIWTAVRNSCFRSGRYRCCCFTPASLPGSLSRQLLRLPASSNSRWHSICSQAGRFWVVSAPYCWASFSLSPCPSSGCWMSLAISRSC